ncbi:MAG: hypothetical protein JHC93_02925 [Parachlamydiales bacterium]|nr:hypothetical protein [Parachlamydiales bacterium]
MTAKISGEPTLQVQPLVMNGPTNETSKKTEEVSKKTLPKHLEWLNTTLAARSATQKSELQGIAKQLPEKTEAVAVGFANAIERKQKEIEKLKSTRDFVLNQYSNVETEVKSKISKIEDQEKAELVKQQEAAKSKILTRAEKLALKKAARDKAFKETKAANAEKKKLWEAEKLEMLKQEEAKKLEKKKLKEAKKIEENKKLEEAKKLNEASLSNETIDAIKPATPATKSWLPSFIWWK